LAVVALQLHHAQPGLARAQLHQALKAAIRAAVVDGDDLRGTPELVERRAKLPDEPLETLLLVVDRNDDRQRRRRPPRRLRGELRPRGGAAARCRRRRSWPRSAPGTRPACRAAAAD